MDIASIISLVVAPLVSLLIYYLDKHNPSKLALRREQIEKIYAPLAKLVLTYGHFKDEEDAVALLDKMLAIVEQNEIFHLVPVRLIQNIYNWKATIAKQGSWAMDFNELKTWILREYVSAKRKAGYPMLARLSPEFDYTSANTFLIASGISFSIFYLLNMLDALIKGENPTEKLLELASVVISYLQPVLLGITVGFALGYIISFWYTSHRDAKIRKQSKPRDS